MTRGSNVGTFGTGALFGGSYAFGASEADTDLFSTARLPDAAVGAASGAVVAPFNKLAFKASS